MVRFPASPPNEIWRADTTDAVEFKLRRNRSRLTAALTSSKAVHRFQTGYAGRCKIRLSATLRSSERFSPKFRSKPSADRKNSGVPMATTTLLERNPAQMGLSASSRDARSGAAPIFHQRRLIKSATIASDPAPQATPVQNRRGGGGGGGRGGGGARAGAGGGGGRAARRG